MRKLRTAALTAALLVAIAIQAEAAVAQEVATASCPGPATSNRANGPVANAGNARFAQTFTAQHTGALTRVELGVTSTVGSPADWVVQILPVTAAGVPHQSITLADDTIDDATIPMSGEITADLDPPATVTAGQVYAVAVTHPGSTSVGVRTVPADPCPGDLFFAGAAPDPFSPEGSTDEMVFTAYVIPFAPVEPPAPPPPGQVVAQDREDPKCERLRRKLKRQKRNLERADTEGKQSMLERNIAETHRRLRKLDC
jgi:hypothetical protein